MSNETKHVLLVEEGERKDNNDGDDRRKPKKTFEFAVMDEHSIPLETLISKLGANPEKGLTSAKAFELNKIHGDNVLTEHKKTHWFIELLIEMFAPFSLLLWAGAALSTTAYLLEHETKSHVIRSIDMCSETS